MAAVRGIPPFYQAVVAEMRKVTWPERAAAPQATIAIIVFVLLLGSRDRADRPRVAADPGASAFRRSSRGAERMEHRWYAIQTTAGHENKVRSLIQRKIDADPRAAGGARRFVRRSFRRRKSSRSRTARR